MQFNFLQFSSSVLGKTGLDPCRSFLLTLSENLKCKAVSALRLTSPSPYSFSQVIGSAERPSIRCSSEQVVGAGIGALPVSSCHPHPSALREFATSSLFHISVPFLSVHGGGGVSNVHRAIGPLIRWVQTLPSLLSQCWCGQGKEGISQCRTIPPDLNKMSFAKVFSFQASPPNMYPGLGHPAN